MKFTKENLEKTLRCINPGVYNIIRDKNNLGNGGKDDNV